MKRLMAGVMMLVLLLFACTVAGAETKEYSLKARNLDLNKFTGTLSYQPMNSDYYQIIDASGQVLLGPETGYTYMSPSSSYPFFNVEVKSEDGVHRKGLLDGNGRVLVPAEYADVNIISIRWQAGIKLTPCAAEDKDYTYTNWSTGEKSFYRVETADFFFDGQKVGTLNRSDYGGGNCTAYNAYLCITNLSQEKVFYNNKMEKSPYQSHNRGEFDNVYQKGISVFYHQGSGQQVFVSSCTLDPADLYDPYLYNLKDGVMKDIKGNALFKTAQVYDTVRDFTDNGYAVVRKDQKCGLIDLQGIEVIPPIYDELGNYEDNLFAYGYISAVKDGKFGFLDAQGKESVSFVYSSKLVKNRTTFATVENLDGTIIVLSAAVGELKERFADVSFPSYYGCMAFIGENANKQQCVVDLYGNTLLPYRDGYRYINLTLDGSVCMVSYGSSEYDIFQFEIQASKAPEALEKLAPTIDDSSWICENGHTGNTGKFCSECGVPKPVVQEKPTKCSNCNNEFGETVPKFCPECGTKVTP